MDEKAKTTKIAIRVFLAMALFLTTVDLPAQETRKVISNPAPAYPETARRFRVPGVVKGKVVMAPDGRIKITKIIGALPLLGNAGEERLDGWKYAPAGAKQRAT